MVKSKKIFLSIIIIILIAGTYLTFDVVTKSQSSYYETNENENSGNESGPQAIKLKMMLADSFLKDISKRDALDNRMEEFKNQHKEIQSVDIDMVPWEQIVTKYMISFATGEAPDMAMLPDYSVRTNILNNRLLSLNEYIPKDVRGDWRPELLEAVSSGNKVFGYIGNADICIMYYNKEIYKKAGLNTEDTPKTWNELISAAQQTNHVMGLEQYGFGFVGDKTIYAPLLWSALVLQQGGSIADDQGKAVFDNKESVLAARLTADMINKYNVTPKSVLASDNTVLLRDFMNGRYAMIMGDSSQYADMKKQSNFDMNKIGWFKVPSLKSGSHLTFGTFWTFSLSSQTKYPDLAYGMLTSVVNDETMKSDIREEFAIPTRRSWADLSLVKDNNLIQSWTDYFNKDSFLSTNINFAIELFSSLNEALQKAWDGEDPKEMLTNSVKQFNNRYYYDTYNFEEMQKHLEPQK